MINQGPIIRYTASVCENIFFFFSEKDFFSRIEKVACPLCFVRFRQGKCPAGQHMFEMHDFSSAKRDIRARAVFWIPINVLNGPRTRSGGLNGWNDLNALRYLFARGIALLLERRFQHEKAAPKLLNRVHSALLQ